MKKIAAYFFVGILSSFITIAAVWYAGSKGLFRMQNQQTVNGEESDENNFSFVDYKGNFNVTTPDFVDASKKSVDAVVYIKNFSSQRARNFDPFQEFFFGNPQRQQRDKNRPSGIGSGVIISSDGYIVTNNHVIKGAEKVEVTLNNQKTYQAEIVGTDPNTDIALLKISETNLPNLKFVNSDNVNVGDWVLAVGNPFGLNSTVTAGIVSAKGRSIDILRQNGNNPIESFIQTDAAINPGNSGGALVNPNGDLVGINTAISSQTGSYVGYGFAVPSNLVKKIVEDIKQYGLVQRGYIGISGLDLSDEDQLRRFNEDFDENYKTQSGVLITNLTENGAAISAGLEEGDIIKKVDGKPIKKFSNLSFIVGSKRPGDNVAVEVLRNGRTKSYNITLRDAKGNSKLRNKSDLTVSEKLGASFEPLSERQKVNFGIDYGVVVSDIESNGKLRAIGMNRDFILLEINGEKIKNVKDVDKILKNKKGKVSVSFVDPYGRIYKRGFEMN